MKNFLILLFLALLGVSLHAGNVEPPPDPGFDVSVKAADVIVDADIIAGGPFRAVAQTRKIIKGDIPKIFELEGFNSYNWDTVHQGFAAGSRYILFLSRTGQPNIFAMLTPAAPRFAVLPDGVLFALGDPPFRVPVKPAVMDEGLALLMEASASGKVPERAEAFLRSLWEAGDIEPRYLAIALAGALREKKSAQMLIDASRDKLLKLRLTAIDALGKVNSPQTVGALRALLKDEKASIAREAARVLTSIQDADSLPGLLEWVRRACASATGAAASAGQTERAKAEIVAASVLNFAGSAGSLLDNEALCRPLIQIARLPNDTLARNALQVLILIGQTPQISVLLEMADDNTYAQHVQAAAVLRRLTLKDFRDTDEFRAWWTDAEKGFGEDHKRDRVEAAAKGLAKDEDAERGAADLIRMAPGEIALVSAAPLLLNNANRGFFSIDDLKTWHSALTLPFLLERFGRISKGERLGALEGLVQLAAQHPRLKEVLWPLVRAALADDDSATRRAAQAACGAIPYPDSAPALIDAVQYHSAYESHDASLALYNFTARTMGFSIKEPMPDQILAQENLRGWWEGAKASFQPVFVSAPSTALLPSALWPDMEAPARAAKLEAAALDQESRTSATAFAVLYAERGPESAWWKKLLSQGRQRDKAHALLGLLGGDAALAPDLTKRLFSEGENAEPPLCRALSLVGLASLKMPGSAPNEIKTASAGAEKIVEWLKGPGTKFSLAWRRLAIICLGLCDGEPQSLACLGEVLEAGLAAKPPDPDTFPPERPSDEYALLTPAVAALCARPDSTDLLMKLLKESEEPRMRERAARALSLRRHRPAVAAILKAIGKADRFGWQDLCRAVLPLLVPGDAPAVCALLDESEIPPRFAAAFILAMRPDINDAETRGQLLTGLSDHFYLVRYFCAVALGKRHASSAIKNLVDLLRDDDDEVRNGAVEALGEIGDTESCVAAASVVVDQPRIDPRWLRAMAIGGDNAQFQVVLKLCQSNYVFDQRAGVEALSASKQRVARETLLKVYRDDDAPTQTEAANALAARGDAIVDALEPDLKDADKNVRARALYLLARIHTALSRSRLEQALKTEEDAGLRALAEYGMRQ